MAINLRWVGEEDYDRVAETRLRCYAPAEKDRERYRDGIRADQRAQPGDLLLAEDGDEAVGTAASLSMHMWVRGGRVPCQGVAYVGTIPTQRRAGNAENKGIATRLMHETLNKAREREQVVSALMPFRASFYEHFGYGLAERRVDWIVPLSIMPAGSADGMRYATPDDRPHISACRQRCVERGQCDIETSPAGWENRRRNAENGFEIVDVQDGQIRGYALLMNDRRGEQTVLRVNDHAIESSETLLRLLRFLGGQKDQYSAAWITLPADLPLNRLLREAQLPHRPVTHAFARAEPMTRMQVRVLDHKRFLEAMRLPPRWTGAATVAVRETEGTTSQFRIDIDAGHVSVETTSQTPDVECSDVVWASIATGDLPAPAADRLGLIRTINPKAIDVLSSLSDGLIPFCGEYF